MPKTGRGLVFVLRNKDYDNHRPGNNEGGYAHLESMLGEEHFAREFGHEKQLRQIFERTAHPMNLLCAAIKRGRHDTTAVNHEGHHIDQGIINAELSRPADGLGIEMAAYFPGHSLYELEESLSLPIYGNHHLVESATSPKVYFARQRIASQNARVIPLWIELDRFIVLQNKLRHELKPEVRHESKLDFDAIATEYGKNEKIRKLIPRLKRYQAQLPRIAANLESEMETLRAYLKESFPYLPREYPEVFSKLSRGNAGFDNLWRLYSSVNELEQHMNALDRHFGSMVQQAIHPKVARIMDAKARARIPIPFVQSVLAQSETLDEAAEALEVHADRVLKARKQKSG